MVSIGDEFTSQNGSKAVVISYLNNKNITVKYSSGVVRVVQKSNLIRGSFKDPMLPSVIGVGVLGDDDFKSTDQSCITWRNMLRRVYSPKPGLEYEAYKDCSVCEDWLFLPNFRKWFDTQVYYKGYQLDKDLLFKNNKVYSADTCVFVPQEVNKFLTNRVRKRGLYPVGVSYKTSNSKFDAKLSIGSSSKYLGLFDTPEEAFAAYKEAKENEAKRLADLWEGKVDRKVIHALRNFSVSIED